MRLSKIAMMIGLAASIAGFTTQAAVAEEKKQEQAVQQTTKSIDERVDDIGAIVNMAEDSVQKTLDDLRKEGGKFGQGWNNIEEGFVFYTTTEAEYFRTMLDNQEIFCRQFGGDECKEIAAEDLEKLAKQMLIRSQIIKKVAFNQPIKDLNLKLTEDAYSPIYKAIQAEVTHEPTKVELLKASRGFMKMKMTYLGLISELAKFYKNQDVATLVEHEMTRLNGERTEVLKSVYARSGKPIPQPRTIGPKRRNAMIGEFAN